MRYETGTFNHKDINQIAKITNKVLQIHNTMIEYVSILNDAITEKYPETNKLNETRLQVKRNLFSNIEHFFNIVKVHTDYLSRSEQFYETKLIENINPIHGIESYAKSLSLKREDLETSLSTAKQRLREMNSDIFSNLSTLSDFWLDENCKIFSSTIAQNAYDFTHNFELFIKDIPNIVSTSNQEKESTTPTPIKPKVDEIKTQTAKESIMKNDKKTPIKPAITETTNKEEKTTSDLGIVESKSVSAEIKKAPVSEKTEPETQTEALGVVEDKTTTFHINKKDKTVVEEGPVEHFEIKKTPITKKAEPEKTAKKIVRTTGKKYSASKITIAKRDTKTGKTTVILESKLPKKAKGESTTDIAKSDVTKASVSSEPKKPSIKAKKEKDTTTLPKTLYVYLRTTAIKVEELDALYKAITTNTKYAEFSPELITEINSLYSTFEEQYLKATAEKKNITKAKTAHTKASKLVAKDPTSADAISKQKTASDAVVKYKESFKAAVNPLIQTVGILNQLLKEYESSYNEAHADEPIVVPPTVIATAKNKDSDLKLAPVTNITEKLSESVAELETTKEEPTTTLPKTLYVYLRTKTAIKVEELNALYKAITTNTKYTEFSPELITEINSLYSTFEEQYLKATAEKKNITKAKTAHTKASKLVAKDPTSADAVSKQKTASDAVVKYKESFKAAVNPLIQTVGILNQLLKEYESSYNEAHADEPIVVPPTVIATAKNKDSDLKLAPVTNITEKLSESVAELETTKEEPTTVVTTETEEKSDSEDKKITLEITSEELAEGVAITDEKSKTDEASKEKPDIIMDLASGEETKTIEDTSDDSTSSDTGEDVSSEDVSITKESVSSTTTTTETDGSSVSEEVTAEKTEIVTDAETAERIIGEAIASDTKDKDKDKDKDKKSEDKKEDKNNEKKEDKKDEKKEDKKDEKKDKKEKEAPVIAGAAGTTISIASCALLLAGVGGIFLTPLLIFFAIFGAGTAVASSAYGTMKYNSWEDLKKKKSEKIQEKINAQLLQQSLNKLKLEADPKAKAKLAKKEAAKVAKKEKSDAKKAMAKTKKEESDKLALDAYSKKLEADEKAMADYDKAMAKKSGKSDDDKDFDPKEILGDTSKADETTDKDFDSSILETSGPIVEEYKPEIVDKPFTPFDEAYSSDYVVEDHTKIDSSDRTSSDGGRAD